MHLTFALVGTYLADQHVMMPYLSLPVQEKVNIKLRALFARMMWLPMLDTESGKLPRTRHALADCIRADAAKDRLEMNFSASRLDDPSLAAIAKAMHRNLAHVNLDFGMCTQITVKGVAELAKFLPAKLRTIRLNFKLLSCVGIDSNRHHLGLEVSGCLRSP